MLNAQIQILLLASILSRIQIRALAYSGLDLAGKTITTPALSLETSEGKTL